MLKIVPLVAFAALVSAAAAAPLQTSPDRVLSEVAAPSPPPSPATPVVTTVLTTVAQLYVVAQVVQWFSDLHMLTKGVVLYLLYAAYEFFNPASPLPPTTPPSPLMPPPSPLPLPPAPPSNPPGAGCRGTTTSGITDVTIPAAALGCSKTSAETVSAYCNGETNGGGWMLLLTQTDGIANFDGSVVPFTQTAGSPSTTDVYAYDWSSSGSTCLVPQADDEFMITRQRSDGVVADYVTMTLNKWCGGEDWLELSDSSCGGSSHPAYGQGSVTLNGASYNTAMNFHGCSHGGNCASGGGDGVGFSTHGSWAHGGNSCFGGCWNSVGAGGAPFYWNDQPATDYIFSYYWKPGSGVADP